MSLRARWVRACVAANRVVLRHWPESAGRALAWRILHRLSSRHGVELEARTVWGGRFRCDVRDFVPSRLVYTGVWEPGLTRLVEETLRPGDIFVDVGANIGYFTLLASRLVGPQGRVVAVEASPTIADRLERHVVLNGATNVRVARCAITDREGPVTIFLGPPANSGASSLSRPDGGTPDAVVPGMPLARALTDDELRSARMIKLDIEGHEAPVLAELIEHADRLHPECVLVVEVSPAALEAAGLHVPSLFAAMRDAGFDWAFLRHDYDLSELWRTEAHPPTPSTAPPTVQTDVVFRRTRAAVPHEQRAPFALSGRNGTAGV